MNLLFAVADVGLDEALPLGLICLPAALGAGAVFVDRALGSCALG
jgi:hypothetical protein